MVSSFERFAPHAPERPTPEGEVPLNGLYERALKDPAIAQVVLDGKFGTTPQRHQIREAQRRRG